MRDFWFSCGHHLLDRGANGGLVATNDFLKAYFVRPELRPADNACAAERDLHRAMLEEPRRPVAPADVEAMADPDARENWRFVLRLRDLLLRHPTLEAAYLALIGGGAIDLPPVFVNQLTHVILRNALDGCEDVFVLRAAELFFRPQRIVPGKEAVLALDEEWVAGMSPGLASPLISMLDIPVEGQIDILGDDNAETYWRRSDLFDMALDLLGGRRGPAALARAMQRWLGHLLGLEVEIQPLTHLHDAGLSWYVGLDAEATRMGDRLWKGEPLDEHAAGRVLGLFRLTFADETVVAHDLEGEPVYLIMATTPDSIFRMKPQNLIIGLPVKRLEAAG